MDALPVKQKEKANNRVYVNTQRKPLVQFKKNEKKNIEVTNYDKTKKIKFMCANTTHL